MRTALAAVVLALTGLVAGCGGSDEGAEQDDQGLQTFEGPDFSIDLPGEPEVSNQTVPSAAGDIDVTLYTVENGDAAVAVAVTTAPEGAPIDLDGAVDGAASNVGGTVEESGPITYDGYEGREARITAVVEGTDVTAFARVLEADGRLVQIQQLVKGEDLQDPPASYEEIVESLELS